MRVDLTSRPLPKRIMVEPLLFQLPWGEDVPPLPGTALPQASSLLEHLLEDLLNAAGANMIYAPAQAPDGPGITDAFAALQAASSRYEVAPGIGLADHFWTHQAPYRDGTVGRQLARTARQGRPVQGFLALYATHVRSPLIYCHKQLPLRVSGKVGILPDVEGPYLVLVACEGRPDGSAQAMAGFALPVFKAQRFMPIRSDLDRDVLRALEHLQVSLDAHGFECTVQRDQPCSPLAATSFNVTVTTRTRKSRHFRLVIDPEGRPAADRDSERPVDFVINHRNWADGSFVAWLEKTLAV